MRKIKKFGQDLDHLWASELESEGYLVELIIDILYDKNNQIELELGVPCQDALYEHADKTIEGQANPSRLKEYWALLPKALEKNHRENFRSRIIKSLKNADGVISEAFFDCYSEEISVDQLRVDREVVLLLFSPLVIKENVKGLQWPVDFLEKNPSFLMDYSSKSAVDELKERVQAISKKDKMQDDLKEQIA